MIVYFCDIFLYIPLTLNFLPQSGHLNSDPQSGPLGRPGPRLVGSADSESVENYSNCSNIVPYFSV